MPNVSVVFVSTPHVCPSAWSRSHSTFSICTPYSPRLGRPTISLRRDGSYNTGHMAETSDPAKPATSSEAGAVSSTQTTACGEPPRTPCRQTPVAAEVVWHGEPAVADAAPDSLA